jgi:hypothetical protein
VEAAIISGIVGLITGAIGSLIAPWVHWGIEKRRLRLAERKELLLRARTTLSTYEQRSDYAATSTYARVREYLPRHAREAVELPGSASTDHKPIILAALAELEREWGLL